MCPQSVTPRSPPILPRVHADQGTPHTHSPSRVESTEVSEICIPRVSLFALSTSCGVSLACHRVRRPSAPVISSVSPLSCCALTTWLCLLRKKYVMEGQGVKTRRRSERGMPYNNTEAMPLSLRLDHMALLVAQKRVISGGKESETRVLHVRTRMHDISESMILAKDPLLHCGRPACALTTWLWCAERRYNRGARC